MFYDLGLQNDLKTDFKTLIVEEKDLKSEKISRFHSKLSVCSSIKSLNLVSVDCENEKTLQYACNEMDVDLIALDMSSRLNFYLKHDYIKNAVKRGVYFEICYNNINQHTIANAREIVKHTRGKNIIISSNARTEFELKQPADIINICFIFGLSNDLALKAITTNCKELLEKVEAKRTLKGMISLKRKEPSSTDQFSPGTSKSRKSASSDKQNK